MTAQASPPARGLDRRAPEGTLLRGGTFQPGEAGSEPVEDPAHEREVARVGWAGPADVDRAVAEAGDAARVWAATPWRDRAGALRELAGRLRSEVERLAWIDAAESGNPVRAGRADVAQGAAALEFVAGLGGELAGRTLPTADATVAFTQRRPYGVVGRILAYNHPLMFAAQSCAAPLMAGNAVVLKPADTTPLGALELGALAQDVLPPGLLSVLPGPGETAGAALAEHPEVRRVAFTGSVATGRRVLAAGAQRIKHVTLELGGKNPLIVLPDADVEAAADAVMRGMNLTSTAGQSCMSTSRVLVHVSLHDALVEACARRLAALRVGLPDDPGTDVGPLAFRAHHERVVGHIERAVAQGARLVCGGRRPEGRERGYFLEPALFDHVEPEMDLAREEVFGPVIAVLRFDDLEQAIALANDSEYGLTANVITRDLGAALRAVEGLAAGLIWVNGPTPRPPGLPFGGVKQSGLGREHSLGDLLSYTEEVSVLVGSPHASS